MAETKTLRIGEWRVDPSAGAIAKGADSVRLESRTMRLLLCLAAHAGEVVSIDDLLADVWPDVTVTSDSVYQAVASLRRVLGDDPKNPTYIATVPRLGYRMVATVSSAAPRRKRTFAWLAAAALCLIVVTVLVVRTTSQHRSQKSIAVMPFRDLTTDMNEESFADGMTEELIDRLSKVPGLRVPGPRSSFYFRGKRVPVSDIASALGVAYLLDGSVRKANGRLRVSARLIRADSGYVVWSGAFERPAGDVLMIQDDIATQVTNALRTKVG